MIAGVLDEVDQALVAVVTEPDGLARLRERRRPARRHHALATCPTRSTSWSSRWRATASTDRLCGGRRWPTAGTSGTPTPRPAGATSRGPGRSEWGSHQRDLVTFQIAKASRIAPEGAGAPAQVGARSPRRAAPQPDLERRTAVSSRAAKATLPGWSTTGTWPSYEPDELAERDEEARTAAEEQPGRWRTHRISAYAAANDATRYMLEQVELPAEPRTGSRASPRSPARAARPGRRTPSRGRRGGGAVAEQVRRPARQATSRPATTKPSVGPRVGRLLDPSVASGLAEVVAAAHVRPEPARADRQHQQAGRDERDDAGEGERTQRPGRHGPNVVVASPLRADPATGVTRRPREPASSRDGADREHSWGSR